MSEQKWVRSSLRQLSQRLKDLGHLASPPTIGRLLRQLGYSLRVNVKKQEASAAHPNRGKQFDHIEVQKQTFQEANLPIISVDTKKKELIGNFKNPGQKWGHAAESVNVHDFPQEALGKAIPYGIYDLTHNRGSVYVGSSADTAEFAVTAIRQWWEDEGRIAFPHADHLLILADSGGSNGYRLRLWKSQLQRQLSDPYRLTVTICHYPTGCSKWNPIEHRLFSPISLNWAGQPLRTFETMLDFIRGTATRTGLTVRAALLEGSYEKGLSISDAEMRQLNLVHHTLCPQWNYTFRPHLALATDT
jgi:hypothetical protein